MESKFKDFLSVMQIAENDLLKRGRYEYEQNEIAYVEERFIKCSFDKAQAKEDILNHYKDIGFDLKRSGIYGNN